MRRTTEQRELWGIQNYVQIVMRLRLVRRLVHDIGAGDYSRELQRNEMRDIFMALRRVADASSTPELSGFATACLLLCERIKALMPSGYLPVALVADWAATAEMYLRRPHCSAFATPLLELLNDPLWHGALDPAEQARLLRELSQPFT